MGFFGVGSRLDEALKAWIDKNVFCSLDVTTR